MPVESGSSFAGRYTLERELGRGATATVWLAHDTETATSVALKILSPLLAEGTEREHFLREVRRTAEFEHPRILRVLDSGAAEGTLYCALPYMPEGTLRLRLRRQHQLPIADVIKIGHELADALAHAHAHGFVHRDVKPENILFVAGEAHLADFGICRALERSMDESSTSRALVRGTPAYMSPEQASGEQDYDGRSDIFSLGCVLYEMITGVAAFIGPTAEVVLAQRFAHAPREMQVYRTSVPAALEAAVGKCLRVAPADRYRDAHELAAALVHIDPESAPRASRAISRPMTARTAVGGVALAIAVVTVLAVLPRGRATSTEGTATTPDTTRVVVLPLERRNANATPGLEHTLDDELLRDAIGSWDGITPIDQFQVNDALRSFEAPPTTAESREIARALGAGRVVRGELREHADSAVVYLALYDVRSAQALHVAQVGVPRELAAAAGAYQRAVASLLLRGVESEPAASRATHRRTLPAAQAYGRAHQALGAWQLPRADSLFELALTYDRSDMLAHAWLAQVRAWSDRPVDTWAPFAARAAADEASLPARERILVRALVNLADRRFPAACVIYDSLAHRNANDFAAWYGAGQCRTMDMLVVRDTVTSPSGWRFRASRHAALQAYEHAFALLPVVHRSYEGSGFAALRRLFFLTSYVLIGRSMPDSGVFRARPTWRGDSLVLVPQPIATSGAGGPGAIPQGFELALTRQRDRLRDIANGWSMAFPRSSEAKEAVAVALELLGDPAAIDTVRAARRLTVEPERQFALASSEVRLLIKFGLPGDLSALRRARQLADSLLRSAPSSAPKDAERLAALAALRGDCPRAERMLRAAVPVKGMLGIPSDLIRDSQGLLVTIALRCERPDAAEALRQLSARIDDLTRGQSADARRLYDDVLLYRPTMLARRRDPALVGRLAAGNESGLVRAAAAASVSEWSEVRRQLGALSATGQTPDVALIAARLWAETGDTARTREWVLGTIARVRSMDANTLGDPIVIASLVRLMSWAGDLAAAEGDAAAKLRWETAVAALRDPS